MPVAISVENLSKKYLISHQKKERYTALRDVVAGSVKALGRKFLRPFAGNGPLIESDPAVEEFWALKDVDFKIQQGDRVGIIGRNGAGKSTLLKILSRVTEPTSGRISITGRVASLLEVGTGFHPELTGRENVFLNGAILGMGKAEIAKKFDEIVAFAGVDRFIDTPVKRYSSGMYVRLAFSIAAHVESEILVIDEILAVGDAKFQKSCIERIGQIERAGRTVLFVSHNMATVRHLCTKGILLESGKIAAQGDIGGVISRYVDELPAIEGSRLNFQRRESEKPQIASIGFVNQQLVCGESLAIDFECWSGEMMEAAIELEIHDERGAPIIYSSTFPTGNTLLKLAGGVTTKFRLRTSPLNLATGDYFLYVWLMKPWVENFDALKSPLRFSVTESDIGGSGFEFKQSYGRGAVAVTLDVVPAS